MGNYGLEYRNYYEGLKNKSSVRVNSTYSRVEDYLPNRGGDTRYSGKKTSGNNVLNYIVNTLTLQLVGTIVMFLFVFGARYSENYELDKYYTYLKNGINEKVTYSDIKEEIQTFKMSDLVEDIKDSAKWFKEKIESNPLN